MTRILIGSDHGGYNLKNLIKAHLEEHGVEVKDYGCYSEDSCDYPVIAKEVARNVLLSGDRGILAEPVLECQFLQTDLKESEHHTVLILLQPE